MLNFLSVFLSTVLSTYWPLTGQIMYHGIRIGRGSVVPTLPIAFGPAISTDCNFQRCGRRTIRLCVSHCRASARPSLLTRLPWALPVCAVRRLSVVCCRAASPYRNYAECRQRVAVWVAGEFAAAAESAVSRYIGP